MADNGPVPNFTFNQTSITRFYKCRRCINHILPQEYYLHLVKLEDGSFAMIIRNPFNVRANDMSTLRLSHQVPVVTARCDGCLLEIGEKFVDVEGEAYVPPHLAIQAGRYLFYENRLMFWDGAQEVYAHTDAPVVHIS